MRPEHHFIFAVLAVGALVAFFDVQAPIDFFALLILAGVAGVLPDFEHREIVLALFAVLAFLFLLPSSDFLGRVLFGYEAGALSGLLLVALAAFILYKIRPFWGYATATLTNAPNYGAGIEFALLFSLAAYLITSSAELALIFFIAYTSHWVLDTLRYQTGFGEGILSKL